MTNGLGEVNPVPVRAVASTLLLVGFVFSACDLVAQDEPKLVPDTVSFEKLLPILPEAPTGWTAEKPEGSTTDAAGAKITTVHRDYKKGDADNVPTTSISIIDAAANPEMVSATTSNWNFTQTTTEGYAKSLNVDGQPGFETYENEGKHGSLWLLVEKRYLLQIDLNGQEAKELQEWLKRVDLKKLAAVK
ncbi:MAG: hypothetical protein ACJ8KU_05685 [Chthoniobacterales bacterium]